MHARDCELEIFWDWGEEPKTHMQRGVWGTRLRWPT